MRMAEIPLERHGGLRRGGRGVGGGSGRERESEAK